MTQTKKDYSARPYVVGFLLSIVFTLAAYGLSKWHVSNMILFAVLAVAQIVVQLIYFMHLGDKKARWERIILFNILFVILILVFGTIWIMQNLDSNMMYEPHKTEKFIIQDEGFESHH